MSKIFLIAGEPSGDVLGGNLIAAMKAQGGESITFTGIGGEFMEAEGMESLLPMEEICVMGLWEVAGQLPRLLRLVNGVVEEIEKQQPDMVITVDLPDFNFEVGARLKKRGEYKGKIVHYVAPTVWAWRPKRAEKVSAFLDGLICLFPFEPEHFTVHGLDAVFAGHPMIENDIGSASGQVFREREGIPEDVTTLGLFFGSRAAEFKTLGKILVQTASILHEQYPDLHLVVPTLPHLEYDILQILGDIKCPSFVIKDQERKWNAFKACDAAVAVSGTVGLELAYAGVPHVIAYKMHPVSWLLVKRLVKVKHAHLANILFDEEIVPEYLQGKCKPEHISRRVLRLLKLEEERAKQKEKFQQLRHQLGADDADTPSARAARFVLDKMSG